MQKIQSNNAKRNAHATFGGRLMVVASYVFEEA
jgi:hypothetical protein